MPEPISFGKLDLNIVSAMGKASGEPEQERTFSILVMGDFSGRANRGTIDPAPGLAGRRLYRVDGDDLDEVMKRLGVSLNLPLGDEGAETVAVSFSEMDDFHPDRLMDRIELIGKLREELGGHQLAGAGRMPQSTDFGTGVQAPGGHERFAGVIGLQSSAQLLDEIVSEASGVPGQNNSDWDSYLRQITKPHQVPGEDAALLSIQNAIDDATGELLRAILHFPDFQRLEASWRGLRFLSSRLSSEAEVRIYLLDCAKEELAADLCYRDDPSESGLYRLLLEQAPDDADAVTWGALAGDYYFNESTEDAGVYGCIAKIAAAAGAPFVAAAGAPLVGCVSLAESPDPGEWNLPADPRDVAAWGRVKKLPEAVYGGLAAPQFMLRLPYGAATDPIERLEFEEFAEGALHEHYLWGNPCFAVVLLLAQSFGEYGWRFSPGVLQEVEGLPLHVFRDRDGVHSTPCTGVALTERAAEALMERSIIPLVSPGSRDVIWVLRFQAFAERPVALAGPWSA